MRKILNSETVKMTATIIGIILLIGWAIPLFFRIAFGGLLYMLQEPLISIAIVGSLITGFIFGNYETKSK